MNLIKNVLLLIGVFVTSFVFANDVKSYRPPDGHVPTAEVAVAIAETILMSIYGKKQIIEQRPFKIVLKDGVWVVTGT